MILSTASLLAILTLCSEPQAKAAPTAGTFGIVTQSQGTAYRVARVKAKNSTGEENVGRLVAGEGILDDQDIVIEDGARIVVMDTKGNRFAILGPAHLGFRGALEQRRFVLYTGSLKLRAAAGQKPLIETPYMNAILESGEAAVWVSRREIQLISLTGALLAWHPQLPDVKVAVEPGYFTEMSEAERFLQPRHPLPVEIGKAEAFLARFAEPAPRIVVHVEPVAASPAARQPASAPAAVVHEQSAEPHDPHMMHRLQAHIAGQEYEDEEELARKAKAKPLSVEQKKLAEDDRQRKARIASREAAFRRALGDEKAAPAPAPAVAHAAKPSRVPASGHATAKPAVEVMAPSREGGIIQRLMQEK